MRRMALGLATMGALVVLTAAPAWAVLAGQFCSNADFAAGTITTADNGATVQCQANGSVHQWVIIAAPAPTTTLPPVVVTTAALDSGDLQGSRIVSFSAGPAIPVRTVRSNRTLPTTGLNHEQQLVELALLFIGLGAALVIGRRPGVIR